MLTVISSPLTKAGVYALVVLRFNNYLVAGNIFTVDVENGNNSYTFTVVSGAPASFLEIQDNSDLAYASVNDWLDNRVLSQLNSTLATNYTCNLDDLDITITAKNVGFEYNTRLAEINGDLEEAGYADGEYTSNLVLARNPVEFVLSTNNNISVVGVKAYIDLNITGLPSISQTFTLTFLGRTLTFTFVGTTPDASGNQIQVVGSFTNYPELYVKTALSNNFFLNQDYEILLISGTQIRIIARMPGSKYSITGTEAVSNFTLGTPVSGVNAVYRDGFRV
jgi:hypothetical protein